MAFYRQANNSSIILIILKLEEEGGWYVQLLIWEKPTIIKKS